MASFRECPNCECTESGTEVNKCKECGKVFCDVCANGGGFMEYTRCPECDSSGPRTIGEIE